jgi:O-antigen/teichoic acid export membrane protein
MPISVAKGGTSASAAMRLITLPVTGLAGLVLTHEIIARRGSTVYAEVALIWSVALVLQFADLGTGAAVINVISRSEDPQSDAEVVDTLRAALRALVVSAGVLSVAALVVHQTIGWDSLLRVRASPTAVNDGALIVFLLVAVALPLALWPRILLGYGYNPVVIVLSGLGGPIALLIGLVLLSAHARVALLASTIGLANLVVALLAVAFIYRRHLVRIREVTRHLWTRRAGAGVFASAAPMFVILVVQPAALQTDRIVLSWRSTQYAVATYSLAAQLYAPLLSVVTAAGAPLWPHFARMHDRSEITVRRALRAGSGVLGLGLLMVAGLLALGVPISRLVGGHAVSPGWGVFIAFAGLLAVQTITVPFGMLLTDPAGLRFQAAFLAAMMVVNLGLSWMLSPSLGDAGPVLGSVIAVALCQLIPCVVLTARRSGASR